MLSSEDENEVSFPSK